MNGDLEKKNLKGTAKDIAFAAVFVALVIGAQFAFSAIPGVEIVTLLFTAYSFTFGVKRGMLAATAFSIVRQFAFGFFPNVLILYLVYFNLLSICMGCLGINGKPEKRLFAAVILSCVCTVMFSLIDFLLTCVVGGYTPQAMQIYFTATLPVMGTQVLCAAVTVAILFIPLCKIFRLAKGKS